mgnify:CR=1 FL=1
MCKTLIILILLFDGTLLKEKYELSRPMEVHECLMYADDHRQTIAKYKEFKDRMKNGWYLNDKYLKHKSHKLLRWKICD